SARRAPAPRKNPRPNSLPALRSPARTSTAPGRYVHTEPRREQELTSGADCPGKAWLILARFACTELAPPNGFRKKPCQAQDENQDDDPAHDAGERFGIGRRPRKLAQALPALPKPVPRSVTDQERQDDRRDSLGHMTESKIEHRDGDDEHEQLSELHADVERQQRCDEVGSRELQHLLKPVGKAEPMHQA